MIIVNDTAVRADRNVYAGLFKIFVARLDDIDKRSRLTAADTLLFARNADRAAADTDLDKVSACFGEEEEAVAVNYVSGADLYLVAIGLANEVERLFLPAAITLRRVDTEYVRTGFHKCRNSFS